MILHDGSNAYVIVIIRSWNRLNIRRFGDEYEDLLILKKERQKFLLNSRKSEYEMANEKRGKLFSYQVIFRKQRKKSFSQL